MTDPKREELIRGQKLGAALSRAWRKYHDLFGEVPHGTQKQMAALVELTPELADFHLSERSEEAELLREIASRVTIQHDPTCLSNWCRCSHTWGLHFPMKDGQPCSSKSECGCEGFAQGACTCGADDLNKRLEKFRSRGGRIVSDGAIQRPGVVCSFCGEGATCEHGYCHVCQRCRECERELADLVKEAALGPTAKKRRSAR